MQASHILPIIVLLAASTTASAGQALPIVSGRYTTESCTRSDALSTRYFKAGGTSTSNENCSLAIKNVDGKIYNVHLACRYKQASAAEDDVVLKVESPMAVTWINQCMEIKYHFCGQ